jgi:ATP-dependent DNA ligase
MSKSSKIKHKIKHAEDSQRPSSVLPAATFKNQAAPSLMVQPPLAPMEALSVDAIPTGAGWQYEPKWDGFRCLIFRDHDHVEIQSKAGKPLSRYFPELIAAAKALAADAFVLDGEIVIPCSKELSFDALLQRIHPAPSRVRRLANETPALVIVFDLLADQDGISLLNRTLQQRRERLEAFAKRFFPDRGPFRLSPATTNLASAKLWLKRVGSTLDGIIAKQLDAPYRPGERTVVQKIKNYRSADCVVGGFRFGEGRKVVGSLLLGLYNKHGKLDHIGFCSALSQSQKAELTPRLKALVKSPGFTGNKPGGPSRWATERSAEWQPLKPRLVVEVCYDHFSGGRFRHGTRLLRWRPDKPPKQCTFDQVAQKSANLLKLLGA